MSGPRPVPGSIDPYDDDPGLARVWLAAGPARTWGETPRGRIEAIEHWTPARIAAELAARAERWAAAAGDR